jgi:hypothetical protein
MQSGNLSGYEKYFPDESKHKKEQETGIWVLSPVALLFYLKKS